MASAFCGRHARVWCSNGERRARWIGGLACGGADGARKACWAAQRMLEPHSQPVRGLYRRQQIADRPEIRKGSEGDGEAHVGRRARGSVESADKTDGHVLAVAGQGDQGWEVQPAHMRCVCGRVTCGCTHTGARRWTIGGVDNLHDAVDADEHSGARNSARRAYES